MSDIGDLPFPPGGRILEVGCGNGKTAVALAKRGYRVTGMDFSQKAIDICRELILDVDFVCASVLNIPFENGSFDGISAFHVLEHLTEEELAKAAEELHRVMRDGGYLLVKCFAEGDLRSSKGTASGDSVIRGNGILYHYFTEDELLERLSLFECVSIRTVEERTRFGAVRRRIEAVLRKG